MVNSDQERQQQDIWDTVATAWEQWQSVFERGAGVISAELVKDLKPADSVLDFATGLGEPALTAAHVVGESGHILGIDVSPQMIQRAQTKAAALTNVTFEVAAVDRAALSPDSLDAVVSRWGLSFVNDPGHTLRRLTAALRPAGRLAVATWCEPATVPMISLAFQEISRVLELSPPPPMPGPFALADPAQLTEIAQQAGLEDIRTTVVSVPFVVDSPDDFVRFSRDILPPGMRATLTENLGTVDSPRIWEPVRERARHFFGPDGALHLTCDTNILTGRKPHHAP